MSYYARFTGRIIDARTSTELTGAAADLFRNNGNSYRVQNTSVPVGSESPTATMTDSYTKFCFRFDSLATGYTFLRFEYRLYDKTKTVTYGFGMSSNNPTASSKAELWDISSILPQTTLTNYVVVELRLYVYSTAPTVKTVTFYPQNGEAASTTECTVGEAYVFPTTPTWSGKLFVGWFDAASGGTEIASGTTFTDSSPTDLYAHWEDIPVTSVAITYVLNGGSGGPESTSVTQGSTYTIPQNVPTKASYTFAGWLVGEGTEIRQPGYSFQANEDTTISAQWSGGPIPPTPRPRSEADFIVRSASSDFILFNTANGSLVYAV